MWLTLGSQGAHGSHKVWNIMRDHDGTLGDLIGVIPFKHVEDFVGFTVSLGQTIVQLNVEILKKLDWLNDRASGS
jgi:hypothetical protein